MTAKVSRLGYKIKEVPIRYYPRSIEEGKKLRLSDGLKAIGTLLKYRFGKYPNHENSTTSKKNTPSTKKGTATPQKEGISFSRVAKNIFAVVIVLFLLNKFVLDVQPGYNWAYNMLQKNLETIRHYSRTTTDNRFEMKLGLSHVYLRYVKENTPENAVILLPGKEAFYPEGEERIFSGEPYNKTMGYPGFLYPAPSHYPIGVG